MSNSIRVSVTSANTHEYVGTYEGATDYPLGELEEKVEKGGLIELKDAWELVTIRQTIMDRPGGQFMGENRSYMCMPIGPLPGAIKRFTVRAESFYSELTEPGFKETADTLIKQAEDVTLKARAQAAGIVTANPGMRNLERNPTLREVAKGQ